MDGRTFWITSATSTPSAPPRSISASIEPQQSHGTKQYGLFDSLAFYFREFCISVSFFLFILYSTSSLNSHSVSGDLTVLATRISFTSVIYMSFHSFQFFRLSHKKQRRQDYHKTLSFYLQTGFTTLGESKCSRTTSCFESSDLFLSWAHQSLIRAASFRPLRLHDRYLLPQFFFLVISQRASLFS